jgi:hypothetical protein
MVVEVVTPSSLVQLNTQEFELPCIPVPQVAADQVPAEAAVAGDIISFSGKALPKKYIVVYIHSEQALIYRTRSDSQGRWQVNHSQDVTASPTAYAVTIDGGAQVKSRPSVVSTFEVKRNFWVMLYRYLNWPTTAAALVVLLLTLLWLYRVRNKTAALAA